MEYKLFLDDYRNPEDAGSYMHKRIGKLNPIYFENGWIVCKTYEEFTSCIKSNGIPSFVSFDHDLLKEHYWKNIAFDYVKVVGTGYHCAVWLSQFCNDTHNSFPDYAIHSMNEVGEENIRNFIINNVHKSKNYA